MDYRKKNSAILHLDGDAFFASVEISKNPRLRGKPVVTGSERGIATALTYEAKALGITRGMPIFHIRKFYPKVIVLPSDYDTILIYSNRMLKIVENFVDVLEPYSIDECFAEINIIGTIEDNREKLQAIGRRIKERIKAELDITVSLGIAETKVLAKVASKWKKPDGLTVLPKEKVDEFLKEVPIGKIWGIGGASAVRFRHDGIGTALQLKNKPREFIYESLHKPSREIWHELRGERIFDIRSEHDAFKSILRSRSFSELSNDKKILISELSHNLEIACARARENAVRPRHVHFFLKTKDFFYRRDEFRLPYPTNSPSEILKVLVPRLDALYKRGLLYRATGVTLSMLIRESSLGDDLFGETDRIKKSEDVFSLSDKIGKKFGTNSISLASSLSSLTRGESFEKKPLCIPFLGKVS